MVEAKFSFCDISVAGTIRKDTRNELDLIVEKSESYLALWKDYNQLEIDSIVNKAQLFKWVSYQKYEFLPMVIIDFTWYKKLI
ncbi:MAG: hypothetical protein HC815_41150 [Richelia sp. RM1_1_1]|nr:hypothetical protein [Richelia sp. RM1_1_1]